MLSRPAAVPVRRVRKPYPADAAKRGWVTRRANQSRNEARRSAQVKRQARTLNAVISLRGEPTEKVADGEFLLYIWTAPEMKKPHG